LSLALEWGCSDAGGGLSGNRLEVVLVAKDEMQAPELVEAAVATSGLLFEAKRFIRALGVVEKDDGARAPNAPFTGRWFFAEESG